MPHRFAILAASFTLAALVFAGAHGQAAPDDAALNLDALQAQLDHAKAAKLAAQKKRRVAKERSQAAAPPAGIHPELAQNPVAYKAIALAWSNNGASAAVRRDTYEEAKQAALDTCNAQPGADSSCYLANVAIMPFSLACLAVAESAASQLSESYNPTAAEAREAALRQCSLSGTNCDVKYTLCNQP